MARTRHHIQAAPIPLRQLPAAALRAVLRDGYSFGDFRRDALAGMVVGIVALPLSMALSIAVGAPPQHGLYTAIVAGFVVACLGGSRTQVTGPTAAFVVILAPIYAKFGLGGLLLAGAMGGGLLVLMGSLRLGQFIEFIPHPVTTGFTAGMRRMAEVTHARLSEGEHPALPGGSLPKGVVVYDISGPLFFGAAQRAMATLGVITEKTRAVILRMEQVPVIDASGLVALESSLERLRKQRIPAILVGLQRQPTRALEKAQIRERPGQLVISSTIEAAIRTAEDLTHTPHAPLERTSAQDAVPTKAASS